MVLVHPGWILSIGDKRWWVIVDVEKGKMAKELVVVVVDVSNETRS